MPSQIKELFEQGNLAVISYDCRGIVVFAQSSNEFVVVQSGFNMLEIEGSLAAAKKKFNSNQLPNGSEIRVLIEKTSKGIADLFVKCEVSQGSKSVRLADYKY